MSGPLRWAILHEILLLFPKYCSDINFSVVTRMKMFQLHAWIPCSWNFQRESWIGIAIYYSYPSADDTVSFLWKLMVVTLGMFEWVLQYYFHSGEIWNFVQFHCLLNVIAIFWKFKIQPLFLGKFVRLGVPREIVSRATLGTRAIGSPPLTYVHEGHERVHIRAWKMCELGSTESARMKPFQFPWKTAHHTHKS